VTLTLYISKRRYHDEDDPSLQTGER
jgi:hypothetical protein